MSLRSIYVRSVVAAINCRRDQLSPRSIVACDQLCCDELFAINCRAISWLRPVVVESHCGLQVGHPMTRSPLWIGSQAKCKTPPHFLGLRTAYPSTR
ncbi:hypothetical protein Zmor_023123 [Zophobas morio]|uniref:Uncharacterized protein n=1 Tax=Zophobas morio TaxID=2755281 RepID=A0AA38M705_9CUCU|nr:hypothetical protein Zmor_023123 [Zophobas morio]